MRFKFSFSLVLLLTAFSLCQIRAAQPLDGVNATLARLTADYRINIFYDYVPHATWKVEGKPAAPQEYPALAVFVKILDKEWRKYPTKFVHNTHLGAIVLVKDLAIDRVFRAAVPDGGRQVLWLDFKRYQRTGDYQRHIIHHEFYHIIDFELNHDSYWQDPAWLALNHLPFKYGRGGASAYQDHATKWYDLDHPLRGFVNRYSTLGVEEDKAEVFACLFLKSEGTKLAAWSKTDPVLLAKTNYIKRIALKLDPAMNEAFWRGLLK